MSITHAFTDPETRKPMMATLSPLNNGSALELHQAILDAAVEQFIINPDLHTLTEFTLTDFCIFVPQYVCYRHELSRTIEPLPDDTEVEKDEVILSRYDVGKLLLTSEKRYSEIREKSCNTKFSTFIFRWLFPALPPDIGVPFPTLTLPL